jgi:hypothetical protein
MKAILDRQADKKWSDSSDKQHVEIGWRRWRTEGCNATNGCPEQRKVRRGIKEFDDRDSPEATADVRH